MVSLLSLYAKNEAAQLKIRIEIKSEKEVAEYQLLLQQQKKHNESRCVGLSMGYCWRGPTIPL